MPSLVPPAAASTESRSTDSRWGEALGRRAKRCDVEGRGERRPAIKAMILRELERKEHKAKIGEQIVNGFGGTTRAR